MENKDMTRLLLILKKKTLGKLEIKGRTYSKW